MLDVCKDTPPTWTDRHGDGCKIWAANDWCSDYGADPDFSSADGVSANEACCVCGGGAATHVRTVQPVNISNSTSTVSVCHNHSTWSSEVRAQCSSISAETLSELYDHDVENMLGKATSVEGQQCQNAHAIATLCLADAKLQTSSVNDICWQYKSHTESKRGLAKTAECLTACGACGRGVLLTATVTTFHYDAVMASYARTPVYSRWDSYLDMVGAPAVFAVGVPLNTTFNFVTEREVLGVPENVFTIGDEVIIDHDHGCITAVNTDGSYQIRLATRLGRSYDERVEAVKVHEAELANQTKDCSTTPPPGQQSSDVEQSLLVASLTALFDALPMSWTRRIAVRERMVVHRSEPLAPKPRGDDSRALQSTLAFDADIEDLAANTIGRRKFETDFKSVVADTFTTPKLDVSPDDVVIDSIVAGSIVVEFSIIVPVSAMHTLGQIFEDVQSALHFTIEHFTIEHNTRCVDLSTHIRVICGSQAKVALSQSGCTPQMPARCRLLLSLASPRPTQRPPATPSA